MSVRSTNASKLNASSPIDFRENLNTQAAPDDKVAVGQILSRLDQLQTKIAGQAEVVPSAKETPTGLHARIATLEKIHEDVLHKLSTKLEGLERKLAEKRETESLLSSISSRNKDTDQLVEKLATKFSQVESRLHSASQLHDRVSRLESRLEQHAAHPERLQRLESRLETDADQERILQRINSKLDSFEQRRQKERAEELHSDISPEKSEKIKALQSRITKLKKLRDNYSAEIEE